MISVLLPVRDAEPYLAGAISSVLAQTIRELELLVLDDGSADGSRAIAERAADVDPRVRVVPLDPVGLPSALNVGIELARHPWIARMDADDLAHPHRLERQLAAAEAEPDVVGWGTWAHGMDGEGRIRSLIARGPTTREEFRRQHRSGLVEVNHATMLLRRDALLEVGGYDPAFDRGEDIELWDRLGELGPLLTLPEPLYRIRIRAGSHHASSVADGMRIARFVAARRRAADRGETLTYDAFLTDEAADGWPTRMRRRARIGARRSHYRATVAYFEGRRIRAGLHLAVTAALAPGFAAGRVWRQFGPRGLATAERIATGTHGQR